MDYEVLTFGPFVILVEWLHQGSWPRPVQGITKVYQGEGMSEDGALMAARPKASFKDPPRPAW